MEIERTAFVDFVENDKVRLLLLLLLPLFLSNFGLFSSQLSCQLLLLVVPNKIQPWFGQVQVQVALSVLMWIKKKGWKTSSVSEFSY